jgi:hypothetical protein
MCNPNLLEIEQKVTLASISSPDCSSKQNLKSRKRTSKPIRKVQFSPCVQVRLTPCVQDLSEDEFSATFHVKEEYHRIKLREAKFAEAFEKEPLEVQQSMQCLNALVTKATRDERCRKARIVTRLVLLEQENQMNLRRRSSQLLSCKYRDLSLEDRTQARERAEHLAQHIQLLRQLDDEDTGNQAYSLSIRNVSPKPSESKSCLYPVLSPCNLRWAGGSPDLCREKLDAQLLVPSRGLK